MNYHRLFALVFMLAFCYMASMFAHEFGHYVAIEALGGSAYITYPDLLGGFCHFDTEPSHLWVVGLSGGLTAALVFFAPMAYIAWRTPTRADLYIEFPAVLIASIQLCYGVLEIWEIRGIVSQLCYLPVTSFAVCFCARGYWPQLSRWLKKDYL